MRCSAIWRAPAGLYEPGQLSGGWRPDHVVRSEPNGLLGAGDLEGVRDRRGPHGTHGGGMGRFEGSRQVSDLVERRTEALARDPDSAAMKVQDPCKSLVRETVEVNVFCDGSTWLDIDSVGAALLAGGPLGRVKWRMGSESTGAE